MIKGFDNAIIGMTEGQTKRIRIDPEDAYGYPDEENIEEVPKYIIMSTGAEPEKGLEVVLHGREGRIIRVGEKNVTVDFNPIFVGKPLNFKIKVIKIKLKKILSKLTCSPTPIMPPNRSKLPNTEDPDKFVN